MQKRKAFPSSEKGGRAVTYRLPTSHSLQFEEKVAYDDYDYATIATYKIFTNILMITIIISIFFLGA